MLRTISIAVVLAAAAHGAALAATCGEEIQRLSRQYQVSPQAPSPQGGSGGAQAGITSNDLSRSGGAIAPSHEPPARVIEPHATESPMPTTPNIPQQTAQGPVQSGTASSAAHRSQMQSLLQAAQAALDQGNEQQCFQTLSHARSLQGSG